MERIQVALSHAQLAQLRERAQQLGVDAADLAAAAVSDLLSSSDQSFDQVAERVLRKNKDLYKRLA